jgi:peptide/nickel transport system substrate-binding protein
MELLAPYPGAVPPQILAEGLALATRDGAGERREAMRQAFELLGEAGFRLEAGEMVHTATRRPLAFEFLAASRGQERLVLAYARTLERLGIRLRLRQVDSAQYWSRIKSFDFDMIQWTWPASLSPGNEQLNRWSSAAADTLGSLNYAGVKSPAADAMIAAMLAATTREDFEAAVRAFDRVLLAGDHVIPLFHVPRQWIAHWRHLASPPATPLFGTDTDTWWSTGERP